MRHSLGVEGVADHGAIERFAHHGQRDAGDGGQRWIHVEFPVSAKRPAETRFLEETGFLGSQTGRRLVLLWRCLSEERNSPCESASSRGCMNPTRSSLAPRPWRISKKICWPKARSCGDGLPMRIT